MHFECRNQLLTEIVAEIKDTYKTISGQSEGFYSEKGSKFLSFAIPIRSEAELKEHLQLLKKKYFDARHHVYAFILGERGDVYRASDDGEPANSSGMPVLGQLRSFELTNVMIVVVRYFGGTKLGVPGLINAYRTAAYDALSKAEIVEETIKQTYKLCFTYEEMNFVMKVLRDNSAIIYNQQFVEECSIECGIKLSQATLLEEALAKNYKVEIEKVSNE